MAWLLGWSHLWLLTGGADSLASEAQRQADPSWDARIRSAAPADIPQDQEDPPPDPPEDPDSSDDSSKQEGKKDEERGWEERVAVKAQVEGSTQAPRGASSSVIDPNQVSAPPTSIREIVADVPGVSENGQGGMFQTFSIRGVSRQRVMSLLGGMRVSSERRAGVSLSFFDPLLLDTVEVIRGPATTFNGSGALGGVVQGFPKRFDPSTGFAFGLGWESRSKERHQVFGLGGEDWSFGFAHREASNGKDGDGNVLNDAFNQYSASFIREWEREDHRVELLVVPTFADDIGKANSDFPIRTTTYPLERHQLVRLSIDSTAGRRAIFYLHHQDLETQVRRTDDPQLSRLSNDSLDYGARYEDRPFKLAENVQLKWGVDLYGRADVEAVEKTFDLSDVNPDPATQTVALDGGQSTELGGFASLQWETGPVAWEGGARLSWQTQESATSSAVDKTAVSGFLGATAPLSEKLQVRGSVSSGLRFASLTERFFSGVTGRGQVVGNPQLDQERAWTSEIGLRYIDGRFVFNTVLFHTEVEDYIERLVIGEVNGDDLLSFVNLTEGTLKGLELQGLWNFKEGWFATVGGHAIEGRSKAGANLADVPADELYIGANHRSGRRLSYHARWAHRFGKDDPGSGERSIPSAEIVSASIRLKIFKQCELSLTGSNLLNQAYLPSADELVALAPGRAIAFSLHFGL